MIIYYILFVFLLHGCWHKIMKILSVGVRERGGMHLCSLMIYIKIYIPLYKRLNPYICEKFILSRYQQSALYGICVWSVSVKSSKISKNVHGR